MTYYSLRMTLPKIFPDLDYPDPDSRLRDLQRVFPFMRKLIEKKCEENSSYSCGYECLNKFGEPCDPHIHFNFVSDCHKESLRRWMTRTFRDIYRDYSLRGNSMYKLDSYSEPDDFDAWFGYPLKECPVHRWTNIKTITTDGVCLTHVGPSVKERHSVAKALLLVRHQKNREYRAKALEKQTLYDKLKKFLDGKWLLPLDASGAPADVDEVSAPSAKQIWLWTLDFYRVCHKPLNMCTIDGYVRLYMWETDLITPESLWALSSLAK